MLSMATIRQIQDKLTTLGLYAGALDGVYGRKTREAVIEFQKQEGLIVDGIAGPQTLGALELWNNEANKTTVPALTLTEAEKLYMMQVVSQFEGNYWTCNRDGEFEGWFDQPRTDTHGTKLTPVERKSQPNWTPNAWSKYGRNPGHVGLSYGFIQFTQDGGNLGVLLATMHADDAILFENIFGEHANELIETTTKEGLRTYYRDSASPTGLARRSPRVQPVGGYELWHDYWVEKFKRAGQESIFQQTQRKIALLLYFEPMVRKVAKLYGISSEKGLTILLDRSIQMGVGGCFSLLEQNMGKAKAEQRMRSSIEEAAFFQRLYEMVRTSSWSHRTRKIIENLDLSFNKQYAL
jgi:hypothetical protein